MTIATIEELAYLIKQAKEKNLPKPIVFLGAGASKTGGIPLAGEIITDILATYPDNPKIRDISDSDKNYPNLMACLTPFERNNLLKGYIAKGKINVTHIYLAQLIVAGYVDYVLTVNFDNLMLRALALFNEFPPVYDMAILKDLTTTSFKEKSVVYLHGQHHGLWLLNTIEEMDKVRELVPRIIDSIRSGRVWIFIGYSGEDPIFKHICNLGRFDNGLYWITYNENDPSKFVCSELLDKPNTNTYAIKGYDADAFMLRLSIELELQQPSVVDKPFTALKEMLNEIVDINEHERFKGVKERLEIAKKDVENAIQQFEIGVQPSENLKKEMDTDLLKKQIIDIILAKNYNESEILKIKAEADKTDNQEIQILLSNLYHVWGDTLYTTAKSKGDETLFKQCIDKYDQATQCFPKNSRAFYNWGTALTEFAKLKADETFYVKSFEKFDTATQLAPSNDAAFYNWGTALVELAKLQRDETSYVRSFEKFDASTQLNPKRDSAFNNWGNALTDLAELKKDKALLYQSFEKFEIATQLNPQNDSAFNNWGKALLTLAKWEASDDFFEQSIEKFRIATQLNPRNDAAFCNWGGSLSEWAKMKKDESLFAQSFEKFSISARLNPQNDLAFSNWGGALYQFAKLKDDSSFNGEILEKLTAAKKLNGSSYNLACWYALENKKVLALENLKLVLDKRKTPVEYIQNDDDWKNFREDRDFIALLKNYK